MSVMSSSGASTSDEGTESSPDWDAVDGLGREDDGGDVRF